jgi:hypothetical protein
MVFVLEREVLINLAERAATADARTAEQGGKFATYLHYTLASLPANSFHVS